MMALKLLCALSWWISAVVAQGSSQLAPSVLKPPGIYMEAVAPTPRRLSVVMDTAALRIAMTDWCADPTTAEVTHGHISGWDVSGVTNMDQLITRYCKQKKGTTGVITKDTFNEDLSGWDVSAVTTMDNTFGYASAFNQPLSAWDVSAVTNMYSMFNQASSFNQPLSGWDVSAVTTMLRMFEARFEGASSFNHVLCWDVTGKVTSDMFKNSPGSVNGACTQCGADKYRVDTTTCAACAAGSFSSPTVGSSGADSCSAIMPTLNPTPSPTAKPTLNPTTSPTAEPTPKPTPLPTAEPTHKPTISFSPTDTFSPSTMPSLNPTLGPGPGSVEESGTPAQAVANGSDGDDDDSNSKVTYASFPEFFFWLIISLLLLLLFLGGGLLLYVKVLSTQKEGHNDDAEEGLALSDNLANSAPPALDHRTTKELPKSFSSLSAFADGSDGNDGRGGSLDRQPPSGGGSGGDGIKI